MTIELVFGLLGTIGSLIVLGREAIKTLRVRAEGDISTTKEALKLARRSREDTGQHLTRWADCEARCRELAERCARLEERLLDSEAENQILRKRVGALEEEVQRLRASIPLRRALENHRRLKEVK